MNGIFTISLDFELHWGGFEKWALTPGLGMHAVGTRGEQAAGSRQQAVDSEPVYFQPAVSYNEYFLNTRRVIPEMLRLFADNQVRVTWATVGLLMHASKSEVNFPALQPTYVARELSAYQYIESQGVGANETEDPFHFAHTLVLQILATPGQELGSHTFAHYYCNEAGQTTEQFRADLQAAAQAAQRYGVRLQSLVFPRNQFNELYLRVCYEEGIRAVRSNPVDWFWKIDSTRAESRWKRLNRGLDAYFPVGSCNTYRLSHVPVRAGLPLCLPASRLLRPYRPGEFFLNAIKINRIQAEMTRAARRGEVYHLWWHPHNFGRHPLQSLQGLEQILNHYKQLRTAYGMQSLAMGEITNRLRP